MVDVLGSALLVVLKQIAMMGKILNLPSTIPKYRIGFLKCSMKITTCKYQ